MEFTDLATALDAGCASWPNETALVFRDEKITYSELCRRVKRCAAGLAQIGIKRGDRFGLMMRNAPEFVIIQYALLRLGAIAVPLNFLLKPGEVEYILGHCGAVGVATQPMYAPVLREAARKLPSLQHLICCGQSETPGFLSFEELAYDESDVAPAADSVDVACILYTSGTTGKPKGVMLTHRNLLANVDSCARAIEIRREDVFICLLPMFHTFAWTTCVLLPLYMGASIVIVESVHPFKEVAAQVRKHHVSVFIAVPPVFAAMARMPFWRPLKFLLPLRLCVTGAAPLPMGVLEKFESKFGLPLLEGYGLTETSPVVSFNPVAGEHRPGTVGLTIPNVEVTIRAQNGSAVPQGEVGEICVRGPNVMLGYFNDPEATREAIDSQGWLRTGDLGLIQSGGYIQVVDRAKDLIIVKGLNVYSREVEEVLLSHSSVAEAAVIGVPDETGDELVRAFVVLKEGRKLEQSELFRLCRERLAAYKMPKDIVLAPFLPKNSIGKVLKRELKEDVAAAVS